MLIPFTFNQRGRKHAPALISRTRQWSFPIPPRRDFFMRLQSLVTCSLLFVCMLAFSGPTWAISERTSALQSWEKAEPAALDANAAGLDAPLLLAAEAPQPPTDTPPPPDQEAQGGNQPLAPPKEMTPPSDGPPNAPPQSEREAPPTSAPPVMQSQQPGAPPAGPVTPPPDSGPVPSSKTTPDNKIKMKVKSDEGC